MKLKVVVPIVAFVLVIAVLIVFWLCDRRTLDMSFAITGKAVFVYGDTNISHSLSVEDVSFLRETFDGKRMYKDNPSCGFSENVSIKFDESHTFCFACDTCPIVYWKEKDLYIKISEDEKLRVYAMLESFGFFFPCV